MSFTLRTATAALLHAGSAAFMAWGYNNLEKTVLNSFIQGQFGGHSQFLTVQALLIACFTMLLSLASDLVQSKALMHIKRAFFMVALPLSVVVSSIYWTLLLLFPSLILQPIPSSSPNIPLTNEIDNDFEPHMEPSSSSDAPAMARIPLSLDLALHALPAISLLLDFFLFERSYGRKAARWGATAMSIFFGIGYASWVEYCAKRNGDWFPYPFLTVNEFPGRVAIYAVVTAIAFMSFQGINSIHAHITGRVPASVAKGKGKAKAA